MKEIGWGILGTGMIARKFAEDLSYVPDAKLVAVGSRSKETAVSFAQEYKVEHAHASYEALAEDEGVDVVYIATPHVFHMENSLLCLDNGKAVLCEKPFTINTADAEKVFARAKEKNLFVMEAMWMVFFPVMAQIRQLLAEGAIGEPRMLTADFGFRADWDVNGRLLNPALGGGALLDVGIYPLSLAQMVFGAPERIVSMAHIGETGVDEQAGIVLGYDGGKLAVLNTAVRTQTPTEAMIMGTEGYIKIPPLWFMPSYFILAKQGEPEQRIQLSHPGTGYQFEAISVQACLRAGKLENDLVSWEETLIRMKTMDAIRAQWGLTYPME